MDDVEKLFHLDKPIKLTRESRILLDKLSFLTGLQLGNIFSGTGSISATQTKNILGRIIRSALSISYGSQNGIIPGIPAVPVNDELLQDASTYVTESNVKNRVQSAIFFEDHNKLVGNANKEQNLKSESHRQGRVD